MSEVGRQMFDPNAMPEPRAMQGRIDIEVILEDEEADVCEGQESLFDVPAEDVPPVEFQAFDFTISTDYCCPRCGYAWSGQAK